MLKRFLTLSCLLVAIFAFPQQTAPSHFDGKTWWDHVKVLADDNMEGRETGSEGLRKAEAYIVEQLQKSGLEPAGEKGFYQTVKFDERRVDEKASFAALIRDEKKEPIVLGEDAYFSSSVDMPSTEVEAPLVFVGYGLKIPEKDDDDYAGIDLKRKVA